MRTIRRQFWGFRAVAAWVASVLFKPEIDETVGGGALAWALKLNGYEPRETVIPLVPMWATPNERKRKSELRRRARS